MAREAARMAEGDNCSSLIVRRSSYLARGEYVVQLERWLAMFPREQLLILRSEDLYQNPARVLAESQAHVGLTTHPCPRFEPHNHGGYGGMSPATRADLQRHFAPYNKQLYALLGRDFGWEK